VTRFTLRPFAIAVRAIVAAICAYGIWCSWALARADHLARINTVDSLRAAIRLEPDSWSDYMHLALRDDTHAVELLETAIKLDPYNAQADIELGLRFEAAGDNQRAEALLLSAYAVDDTFLPRWTLANFYFRRNDMPSFWMWARRAAEMPSGNMRPLFEMCWRVSPDPNEITRRILNGNPDLIRQYIPFLLDKNEPQAAAGIAPRLLHAGDPASDDPQMFAIVDRLIASNDGEAAKALWNAMMEKHWIVADATAPNNPKFARDPLPVGFDWALSSNDGLHSWPGPSGLETEFSGIQPEDCIIAEQAVVLSPGNYEFDYSYRTDQIPPGTGVRWQILSSDSAAPLKESPDLSSQAMTTDGFAFSVPPGTSMVRLRLHYQRALGTPRISGTLVISSVQIHSRAA